MPKTIALPAALLVALAACSRPTPVREETRAAQAGPADKVAAAEARGALSPAERTARASTRPSDDAPYFTALPLAEFMPHVMQYAGDGIWKRQGYRNDSTGLHSLFPKTDEEWEEGESGARTLAEITNVLLIPGRRVPDPAWDKAALGVRAVALRAAAAAERHDADAWFKAGSDLDEACDACHLQFDPKMKHSAT